MFVIIKILKYANLVSSVIGFIGLLLPTIYAWSENKKARLKISVLRKQMEINISEGKDPLLEKMNCSSSISDIENKNSSKVAKVSVIVFCILTVSFLFQILGAI